MTTRKTTAEAVHRALDGVHFPAGKDELAAGAERNGADAATVEALRAVPAEDYGSVTDVVSAVDIDNGPTGDRAPVNPIEDELGTNRKK